jgi:hypothetical protein
MNWIKGKLTTIGLVIGAILLALAAGKAATARNAANRKEDMAADLLNAATSKELAKGKKLIESAHKDKVKSAAAQQKMKDQLDKLGDASEDLDAIADRFNSRRLRK